MGGLNSVLLHVGCNMDPDEVKVPKPSDEWFDPNLSTSKLGDTFKKVENPS